MKRIQNVINFISILTNFAYSREWIKERDTALEFSAKTGELNVKVIDLIKFNENDKIEHFGVILRLANALMMIGKEMSGRIEKAGLS